MYFKFQLCNLINSIASYSFHTKYSIDPPFLHNTLLSIEYARYVIHFTIVTWNIGTPELRSLLQPCDPIRKY